MAAESENFGAVTIPNSHPAEVPNPNARPPIVLSPEQDRFVSYWYSYAELQSQPGLRPLHVQPATMRQFALNVHTMVADCVSLDLHMRHDTQHTILDRVVVAAKISSYFHAFPPRNPTKFYSERTRFAFQDAMIDTAHAHSLEHPEIPIVMGLRVAFAQRRQRHATRAMYGVLSAYGHVLAGDARADALLRG